MDVVMIAEAVVGKVGKWGQGLAWKGRCCFVFVILTAL